MNAARWEADVTVVNARPARTLSELDDALLAHSTETLMLVSTEGAVVHRLGSQAGPLGYDDDGVDGIGHVMEIVHPDDLIGMLELVMRTRVTRGLIERTLVRARHADGHWVSLEVAVKEVGDDPRLPGRAVVSIRPTGADVSEHGQPHVQSLADAVPAGILSADSAGCVVFSNISAGTMFDLPADALLGDGWRSVIDPRDEPDVATAVGAVLARSPAEQVTFRIRAGEGTRWLHARFVPLVCTLGNRTGWAGSFEDVTERRRVESKLAHQATHDPLTGLPNRTLLRDRLEQAAARTARDGVRLAVLFVDLDGFKEVNDRLGHASGDDVLIEMGVRMRTVLRPGDTVARVGGDEFVAVCEAVDEAEADELARRLHEAIGVPVLVDGSRAQVGASIGVVVTEGGEVDPDELLLRADQAMYRAKRSGRPAERERAAS